MDRMLRDLPVSMYLQEPFAEKVDHFCRSAVYEKSMSPVDFDYY